MELIIEPEDQEDGALTVTEWLELDGEPFFAVSTYGNDVELQTSTTTRAKMQEWY